MLETPPLAFVREGRGWLGEGAVLRADFAADGAYRAASEWWRERVEELRADRRPGRHAATDAAGRLVAFGSFSFDDDSPAGATLLVPERAVRLTAGLPRLGRAALPASVSQAGRMSRTAYLAAVERVREAIRDGVLQKAVLARDVIIAPEDDIDPGTVLDALWAAHPGASVFSVDGLIGASPETLVSVHDGVVTARVLAGTAGPAEGDALADSEKDLEEHELAARSVTEGLAPHVTELTTTEPYVLQLPHMTHLATDVRARLAGSTDVLALVAALHPTAAVAGTPSDAAMALIREAEPGDRGRYAGPVGWMDEHGDGEWAIALRCARIRDDGTLEAFAGAGIMADSDPELELAETELKLRPILEALGTLR